MNETLLTKWLTHYDPIHRGWTLAGIANGVCVTNGWCFPRILGGYNLRRAVGDVPGVDDLIVGAGGCEGGVIRTFPWVTHDEETTYLYRIFPIGGGGVENVIDQIVATVDFDEEGNWMGARPNGPSDLRVTRMAGGKFLLQWTYARAGKQAEPTAFCVYGDDGDGSVDFVTPRGEVPYRRGRFHYQFVSAAFMHGARVKWVVRAAAGEVEEVNSHVVSAWAESASPPMPNVVRMTRVEPVHG